MKNTKLIKNCVYVSAILLGMCQLKAADISFRNEIQIAINKGFRYLQENQKTNGYWGNPDLPAMTALALIAFEGDPEQKYRVKEPEFVKLGYDYLLKNVKPDGGIYKENLPTYNTAISITALAAANKPEYEPIIRKARQFLISLQADYEEPGRIDSPLDGGFGYGTSNRKSADMSNTMFALEALYYTKHLAKDIKGNEKDLNYEAAITFLQNCQNLPKYNTNKWVSEYPDDYGGFIYSPGTSMAGGRTNETTGKVSLRSYGSISYSGMLSYIYANLKKNDPRVQAVYDWLKANYTLDENPRLGQNGLYFYYHTMAKALSTYGVDELVLKDGKVVNWRKELAMKLLNLQKQDGSWSNESNRWMEKDPILVTSYSLIALEFVYRGI